MLLWEVTSPGSREGAVYLLGVMHLGRTPIESFDPVIESAFAQSDTLAVEVDVLAVDQRALGQWMRIKGTIHDGSTLGDWLPASLYRELRKTLRTQRMREGAYDALEPWLVALSLASDALERIGYRPDLGMTRHFLRRASASKSIVELEGARAQIEQLDRMPPGVQSVMLAETLRNLPEMGPRARQLERLWRAGDADGLAELIFGPIGTRPEAEPFFETMYFSRNRAMAEQIARALERGERWFVVVGVGHLVGDRGVPALLEQLGHRVRQLQSCSSGTLTPASHSPR